MPFLTGKPFAQAVPGWDQCTSPHMSSPWCLLQVAAKVRPVLPSVWSFLHSHRSGARRKSSRQYCSGLKKCSDLLNCAALKKISLSPGCGREPQGALVVIHLSALHPSHGGIMTGALIWLQEKLKIGLGLTPTTDCSRAMKGLLIQPWSSGKPTFLCRSSSPTRPVLCLLSITVFFSVAFPSSFHQWLIRFIHQSKVSFQKLENPLESEAAQVYFLRLPLK